MIPRLSPIRTAFLKLIFASYGPWYLLRVPSGNWHTCWHYDVDDEQAMESYLIDDSDVDESCCFSTRRAALKEIIKSLDSEIEAGGAGYVAVRQQARDSLISIVNEPDQAAARNDFAGTADETQLIDDWSDLDRSETEAKLRAAKERAAYVAACAEQVRRERVFEQVVRASGEQVIEEINAAIETAWLVGAPKSSRTAHGLKTGDAVPMPQLAIVAGRAVFCIPGRANHLPVRTPLSKRDTDKGYVDHWKHSPWLDVAVPAIAQIIARLEREAQDVPPRGS